ncbi:MAG TPA: antibiotic biosynthesis monooxygenase [Actinomycetes bacterium]|jgi:heme-degrading monooxygenase HmoA|nr:antibiotic biosynthesis monooxygenase [Actinomycetes bacterium]
MFVAINAIEVPSQRSEEFAERFARRAGLVSSSEGFVRFELLRPADGGTRWLVSTHWRSKEDFERWVGGQSFERGHARHQQRDPVGTASELWQFEVVQQEG